MAGCACELGRATRLRRRNNLQRSRGRGRDESTLSANDYSLVNANVHPPWCLLLFSRLWHSRHGVRRFVFADSHAYQALETKKFKQAASSLNPHFGGRRSDRRNSSARLGLKAIVVQGDSPANLKRAVGHLSKSALPGEWGNVALAGHRDTFFRTLRDIRLGDEIKFKTRSAASSTSWNRSKSLPPRTFAS